MYIVQHTPAHTGVVRVPQRAKYKLLTRYLFGVSIRSPLPGPQLVVA